jgi:hypothetical protein
MGVARSIGFTISPQSEERQHGHDHDNQSDQKNNTVHFSPLALVIDRTTSSSHDFRHALSRRIDHSADLA